MKAIESFLKGNLDFISNCDRAKLKELSLGQSPQILWIGCSDSRVCPSIISEFGLGQIFVHRNIANQVLENDSNTLSVVEYAINFLKIDTIIVCGHSACGGVHAALSGLPPTEYIKAWISELTLRAAKVKASNKGISEKNLEKMLVEINIIDQVENLKKLNIVKQAWKSKRDLRIYGCHFEIESGKLKVTHTVSGMEHRNG